MQRNNGDAEVENGLLDTTEEGESGTNGEGSISIYILSCTKWTASEKLLCNTGSSAWCSVMTKRSGVGRRGGRLKRERIYV